MEEFLSSLIAWFQSVWDFMLSGIYDFTVEAFAFLTKIAIYTWIQGQLLLIDIAYQVFREIMSDLGVSQYVRSAYGSLDGDIRSALAFFGLPEAFNMIFSALGTRLAMRFIPFIGK